MQAGIGRQAGRKADRQVADIEVRLIGIVSLSGTAIQIYYHQVPTAVVTT
jgi:hypothetical protein